MLRLIVDTQTLNMGSDDDRTILPCDPAKVSSGAHIVDGSLQVYSVILAATGMIATML
jgi:hypothetical protein